MLVVEIAIGIYFGTSRCWNRVPDIETSGMTQIFIRVQEKKSSVFQEC